MDQRQLFLRDILTVLFKRKLMIASFIVLVFVVVFAANYVWPVTYQSVAKVRIIEGRENLVAPPTVTQSAAQMTMMQMTVEDVNSEMEVIYSTNVLEGLVDELGLDQDQRRAAGPVRSVLRGLKGAWNQLTYALALKSKPSPEQAAVETLRRAIEVKPIDNTYVLEIRCRYSDPESAQQILTTLLEIYEARHKEVFAQPESQRFIEDQLDRVRGELETAQEAILAFRNENKILELEEERKLLVERYSEAKQLLLQIEELGEAAQEVTTGAEPGQDNSDLQIIATLSRETESTVLTEFRLSLLEKVQRRNEIMQTKGPNHPDRVGINSEIEKAVTSLRDALRISEDQTRKQVEDIEARLEELNKVMSQYEVLESQVKRKANAVDYYAEKLEEAVVADATQAYEIGSVKVISEPTLPIDPVSPRRLFNLLLALIGGIIGGIGLAFFFEYLDHGVKTPEDVEHFFRAPPLASFFHTPYEQLDPREAQRLSAMLEAIHPEEQLQLMQVVSSIPGEGSHRVARALAEAAAEDPDRRVLLVDFMGDGIRDVPGGRGLLDVLSGSAELGDVVSTMGSLFVVGRGAQGDCPTYLWHSKRMQDMLDELRQRFDRIVFHVAPIRQSHDALNLARYADGAILVVKADSTRREVVLRSIEMLAEAKGRLLGAVLTERRQVIPELVYKRM